jgi:HAD superfamily hydrolase (TIGR01509 family)
LKKLIIFDLDGVLIDSRELHYESLNSALAEVGEQYVIGREEHLSTFDGLNTTRKLEMLTKLKNLPVVEYDRVWRRKQELTFALLKQIPKSGKLIDICQQLKLLGYQIAVASNSIRESVKLSLLSIGIMEYVDYYISNQDVKQTKPYPEMYWRCMTELSTLPKHTIIVEDSHIGRQGAIDSGSHLLPVENPTELTWELMHKTIVEVESGQQTSQIPWRDKKLNVLIPMAGAGSRFAQQGYTFPKPLIEIKNKSMIEVVVNNLNIEAHYIFLVQKDHYEKYNLKYLLNLIAPGCDIVQVDGVTEGAACTTLLAKEFINNQQPLLIANSDQFIEWNANECMYAFSTDNIDGGMLTFSSHHPKWSYASLGTDGFIAEVAEKKVISDYATVGVYYWRRGEDYVKYAEQMIANNIRVNNEFYVCPVYNEAIQAGLKFRIKNIEQMWGLGTPEDLDIFLSSHKGNTV